LTERLRRRLQIPHRSEDRGKGRRIIMEWNLKEIGYEVVDRMYPAQDRDQRWTLVKLVMRFRFPLKAGEFLD